MNKQTENSPADFSRLTPDHVLGYAETALGRRLSSVCRPLNSYINRVFVLQTEEREGVIAKFYRRGRWSHAALLDEHEFLLELAEREIPVVPPLLLENGKTLGEVARVVAAADDFHLRGRCLHAPGAALQHGVQQVPTAVGQQLQQRFVDGATATSALAAG